MLKSRLALPVIAAAMLAVPALAQTSAPSGAPAGNAQPSMNQNAQPASPTAGTTANRNTKASMDMSDKWRATQLVGVDIYTSNNEKVGEVNEILLDRDGSVQSVVVGIGGFLGVGEKNVAVTYSDVKWMDTPRANASAAAPSGAPATGSPNVTATTGTTGTTNNAAPAGTMNNNNRTAANNTDKRMYPDHGVISMTRQQLEQLPDVKY